MHRSHLPLILLPLLQLACPERPRVWERPLRISEPYQLEGAVAWVDATRGLVIALDPTVQPAQLRRVAIGRNASFSLVSPDRKQLFVLTAGQEAIYKNQQAEPPGLAVLGRGASGALDLIRFYPLSGAFDRLAVSPDGTLAVAYYSSSQGGQGVFRNPNEVALLDLAQPAGTDNPVLRTVRSFGSVPLGVVFSPPMPVPAPSGAPHSLAVVLAQGYLTFLDLTHPRRREITIPLAKPDDAASPTPRQVAFSPASGTLFVRADGAADLYAISLAPQQPGAPDENDYLPSINQPSSGRTPLDMALFSDAGKDLILTVNQTRDLAVIDAATSQAAIIPLGEPADTILPVPADRPKLALIYSQGHPTARVHFLELAGVGEKLAANLTSRNLDRSIRQLLAMPDGRQALVVHDDQRTVVSVLDLAGAHHTVSPIQGQLPLESFEFVEGGQGSFLAGVSAGLQHLGLLDLANLHAGDLRLDYAPRRVLAVGQSIVVDHASPEGVVTIVPGPRATRDECRVLWGIFVDGLLDQELQD